MDPERALEAGKKREKLTEDDKHAIDLFPQILSFFGVELQSHAAMILGLLVGLFAVIQAYRVSPPFPLAYSILTAFIGAAIVHQTLRFYLWGKLASATFYASDEGYKQFKDAWDADPEHGDEAQRWDRMLGPSRVIVFAARWVEENPGLLLGMGVLRFHRKRRNIAINSWVLLGAFLASFGISYSIIYGGSDLPSAGLVGLAAFGLWLMYRFKVGRLLNERGRNKVKGRE